MAVDAPRGVWGDKSPEQRGRATWPGRCVDAGGPCGIPAARHAHAMCSTIAPRCAQGSWRPHCNLQGRHEYAYTVNTRNTFLLFIYMWP